jgi:hypothetical protein
MIPKKTGEETVAQTFDRWLADGMTWIGVFENHDLGHRDRGRRVALPYDAAQPIPQVGVTRAPDHPSIGLGWRYILVAVCHSTPEALAALRWPPWRTPEAV